MNWPDRPADEICKRARDIAYQGGNPLSAVDLLEQAIAARPDRPAYHREIALLYRRLFFYDAAREHIAIAGSLAPDWSSIHYLSGIIYRDLLEIDAAIAAQKRAIGLNTDLETLSGPYYELSDCFFLKGRLKEGWHALAQSFRLSGENDNVLSSHTLPLWTGSISSHRIALICDRGIGDIIQFARFIPLAAQRCSGIIPVCRPELKPVLSQIQGVTEIAGERGYRMRVGAYLPMSSLPSLFGTDMTNIPAQHHYLAAPARKAAEWRQRLARHGSPRHLKIGLAWAGSPSHSDDFKRSMTLGHFAAFERLEGVSLFSLQVGKDANGSATWPNWIVDFGNDIGASFEDTMGLLANLDLVVTVDTAVAHLAGAMGVTTFVLLPFSPDGRWLLDRADTPWYPTLKLFRQPRWQDWMPVIEAVVDDIRQMTGKRA